MNVRTEVETVDKRERIVVEAAGVYTTWLDAIAKQDVESKSAVIRRLIRDEARRRGLVDPIQQ